MTGTPGDIDSLRRAAVPVWDGVVRLVHWLFVVLLIALVSTGLAKGDWLLWHMRAGQCCSRW